MFSVNLECLATLGLSKLDIFSSNNKKHRIGKITDNDWCPVKAAASIRLALEGRALKLFKLERKIPKGKGFNLALKVWAISKFDLKVCTGTFLKKAIEGLIMGSASRKEERYYSTFFSFSILFYSFMRKVLSLSLEILLESTVFCIMRPFDSQFYLTIFNYQIKIFLINITKFWPKTSKPTL